MKKYSYLRLMSQLSWGSLEETTKLALLTISPVKLAQRELAVGVKYGCSLTLSNLRSKLYMFANILSSCLWALDVSVCVALARWQHIRSGLTCACWVDKRATGKLKYTAHQVPHHSAKIHTLHSTLMFSSPLAQSSMREGSYFLCYKSLQLAVAHIVQWVDGQSFVMDQFTVCLVLFWSALLQNTNPKRKSGNF